MVLVVAVAVVTLAVVMVLFKFVLPFALFRFSFGLLLGCFFFCVETKREIFEIIILLIQCFFCQTSHVLLNLFNIEHFSSLVSSKDKF